MKSPRNKSLRKAQLLLAGEEEFLGLFDFLLTLNFGFGKCHKKADSTRRESPTVAGSARLSTDGAAFPAARAEK